MSEETAITEPDSEVESVPSLEQREAEARIAKLDAEKRVLSLQLSHQYDRREWLKVLAGLGGLFAALAAIGTFCFSAVKWQQESFETRQLHIEERLDRALERLGSGSPGTRLSGIGALKSFLNPEDRERHSRVLLSLIHFHALERDPIIRGSVIEIFKGLNEHVISKETLNESVVALAELNRTFVREGKLNRVRVLWNTVPKADSLEAQVQSNAEAIVTLLKKGARVRDLSGIYCVRCDFSTMDLGATNFDNAILEHANFNDAILMDASFDRADLGGTSFIRADLRRAKLTRSLSTTPEEFRTLYSWDRWREGRGTPDFPVFTCADLREADFSFSFQGFVFVDKVWLFPFMDHANLEKANFKQFRFVVVYATLDELNDALDNLKYVQDHTRSHSLGDYKSADSKITYSTEIVWLDEASGFKDPAKGNKDIDKDDNAASVFLRFAFRGTNWQRALLPEGIKDWLARFPPPDSDSQVNCTSSPKKVE